MTRHAAISVLVGAVAGLLLVLVLNAALRPNGHRLTDGGEFAVIVYTAVIACLLRGDLRRPKL